MPVIRVSLDKLERATGLGKQDIIDALFRLKCEAEEIEPGVLEVEVNPDRPDMLISEGIIRAIKGIVGKEKGYTPVPTTLTDYVIEVGVVGKRKYIGGAIIKNVNVDDEFLSELIQFQEKLHLTFGRRRRKVAIGFHDLSKIPCNSLEYKYIDPAKVSFQPLHIDREYSGVEVLEKTEQGQLYGSINREELGHPFLLACGQVIAMPPVINADITRVEPGTKDLFIDITGPDKDTVLKILDVIVSNLAEKEFSEIGKVTVKYGEGKVITPLLKEEELVLEASYTNQTLGFTLEPSQQSELLERMRFKVKVEGKHLKVTIPPYRVDILGIIDLVEDIAIAYGYENIPIKRSWPIRKGSISKTAKLSRILKDLLVGMGYTEVMQLVLTGPQAIEGVYGDKDKLVRVSNPVMQEYSLLRPSLIPGLLSIAKTNLSVSKPVKIFEIGPTVFKEGDRLIERIKLGILIMDDQVSYEQIQATTYKLLRLLDLEPKAKPDVLEPFINGRTARIIVKNTDIGVIGEISPDILVNKGIDYPVAIGELDISELLKVVNNDYRDTGHAS